MSRREGAHSLQPPPPSFAHGCQTHAWGRGRVQSNPGGNSTGTPITARLHRFARGTLGILCGNKSAGVDGGDGGRLTAVLPVPVVGCDPHRWSLVNEEMPALSLRHRRNPKVKEGSVKCDCTPRPCSPQEGPLRWSLRSSSPTVTASSPIVNRPRTAVHVTRGVLIREPAAGLGLVEI